ncbi:hypothetical protein [Devosia sp. A449]
MRRRMSVLLRDAAGVPLELMQAVLAHRDSDIKDLQRFLSIAGELESTAESWSVPAPVL